MGGTYTTVFEVSWFGDANLLKPLLFLSIGVMAVFTIGRRIGSDKKAPFEKWIFYCLWVPIWFGVTLPWLFSTVRDTWRFRQALRYEQCAIVEGTVSVLYEQPGSGHASGDRIRIGDKEFVYSYFHETVAYHRTVAHGGALINGATARLHYLADTILKVEVKQ